MIHLNEHVDTAENVDLIKNLYKLTEYSDNYSDTATSSYHYKSPDQTKNNNLIQGIDNTLNSFKYQSELIKKQQANAVNVGQDIDPDIADAHRSWKMLKLLCL